MLLWTYPIAAWLLLLVVGIGVVTWPRGGNLTPPRALSAYVLRLLAAILIVIAMAQPILVTQHLSNVTYHVIDLAAAPPETLAAAVYDRWQEHVATSSEQHLLAFGSEVKDITLPTGITPAKLTNALQAAITPAPPRQSPLADVLTQITIAESDEARGRILVYTDGWLSGTNPAPLIANLAQRGLTFTPMPIDPAIDSSVVVHRANLPSQVAVGRTVPVTLEISATQPGEVVVRVSADDVTEPVTTTTLQVSAGLQQYAVPLALENPGLRAYRVTCTPAFADDPADNSVTVASYVSTPQQIIVVEGGRSDSTTQATQQLLGPHAEVKRATPDQLSELLTTTTAADLIVWGNPPANAISPQMITQLSTAMQNGLGLLMVGGTSGYDLGGYADTQLAELLPVELHQTLSRHDPSVALVIIIDTSGSMRGARFDLAKETSRLAIQRLKRHDKVGIVEFYGTKRWAARLQSAANAIDVYRALNRLSAGGGTVILPALEEAHAALLNVRAQLKHVLILTDGGVETGPFQRVISRMAEDGITASTVLVGPGRHSAFLSDLAHWGRGRAYQAPDQFRVPEIILRRPTEQRRGSAVETQTQLALAQVDAITDQLDLSEVPAISGAHHLPARSTADVLLQSENGDPRLVRWRYGRGYVAAWLSDLGGPWSRDLWESAVGRTLFANIVRQLTAANPGDDLHIASSARLGGVEIDVRYEGTEETARFVPLTLQLSHADGSTRSQTVDPLTPGRWNAWFEDVPSGTLEITAHSDKHAIESRGALVVPPDVVRPGIVANAAILNQLEAIAQQNTPLTPPPETAARYHDLWPWLVMAAILAFLLNVLVRRWPSGSARVVSIALLIITSQSLFQPAAQADDLTETLARADALELSGDLAAAQRLLAEMSNSLDITQQEPLRLRRALLLHDAGQPTTAVELLTNDLPSDTLSRRARACLLAMMGEPQAARAVLAETTTEPSDFVLRSLLARQAGDLETSAADLSRAAERVTKRRDQRFVAALQVAVAQQRERTAELAQAWLTDPNSAETIARPLFQMLWDLGRRDEALNLAAQRGWLSGEPGSRHETFASEIVTLMLESEDITGTSRALETLRAKQPQQIRWSILLARVQLAEQNSSAAQATLLAAIQTASDPSDLFQVADLAGDANLESVVSTAVGRILSLDPEQAFDVALWQAEWAGTRGELQTLDDALQRAQALLVNDRNRALRLVETLERLERFDEAIVTLTQLEQDHPDLRITEHRAWLLERTQQLAAAQSAWQTVWEQATSLAQQRRAAERVLDLAARTGQLADLAIGVEERLAAGAADSRELDLLLEIYVRVGDSISAGEILLMLADQQVDQVETLRRLAEAYLRMGQVGLCDEILLRLRVQDPERAADYLQQQVLLAIERKRPAEAQQHAQELARLLNDVPMASELTASIFSLLEDHAAAAEAYAQTLNDNPERVELWLLWADAMRNANATDAAIQRLRTLLDQADADDLFLVAVDGLLNLDAPPTVLEFALRRLQLRIAAAPQRTYLFDATADVLEALGRRQEINASMEIAVAFSGEQRGDLIREMMDRAKALRDLPETLALGTILILLDHHVPADVFLDLGALLLQYERPRDAARAFSRATALGEHEVVRRRVGRIYLSALQPEIAGRIFNEQLATTPDDIELRMLAGAAAEQAGVFDTAFDHYAEAYQSCMRQLSGNDQIAGLDEGGRRRRRIAVNLSELEQFITPAINGMLASARSETTRTKLLERVINDAGAALPAADSAEAFDQTATVPARLINTLDVARRVALSLGQPKPAFDIDQRLLAQFPDDLAQRQRIAKIYQEWGQLDLAVQFASESSAASAELGSTLAFRRLPMLESGQASFDVADLNPDEINHLLPALIMLGHDEAARQVLERCETLADELSTDMLLGVLTACVVLDEADALGRWLPRFIDRCGRTADLERRRRILERGLRICWWAASTALRTEVIQRIVTQANEQSPPSHKLVWLAQQLAQANTESTAPPTLNYEQLAAQGANDRSFLSALFAHAPSDQQPTILEQAWTNRAENERATLLAEIAADLDAPLTQGFVTKYRQLLESTAPLRLSRHFPYRELTSSRWHLNRKAPHLGTVMAEAARNWFGDTPAVLVAAAQAHAASNDYAAVTRLASAALEQLIAVGLIDLEQQRMLHDLVRIMPLADLTAQADRLEVRPPGERTRFEQYLLGVVQARLGREAAAIAAYEDAFHRRPADRLVRRELVDYLKATHRWPHLARVLSAYASDPAVMDAWERARLAEAYVQCGALLPAARLLSRDNSTVASLWMLELDAQTGTEKRVVRRLRQKLINNRLERRFFAPNAQYDQQLGGMRGYLRQRERMRNRPLLFTTLAQQVPEVTAELLALLRTASPTATHLHRLSEACWTGLATHGINTTMLMPLTAEADRLPTPHELALATAGAAEEEGSIWLSPSDVLRRALAANWRANETALNTLVRGDLSAGRQEAAHAILRWLVIADLATPRARVDARPRLARIEAYLESREEAGRSDAVQRLLAISQPIPGEDLHDAFDAGLLKLAVQHDLSSDKLKELFDAGGTLLARAVGRAALVNEQWDTFEHAIDRLIDLTARIDRSDLIPLEPAELLPAADQLPDVSRVVNTVADHVRRGEAEGRLTSMMAVRVLCLLADWCVDHEQSELGQHLLEQVVALCGDQPNSLWLWVVDVEQRIDPEAADQRLTVLSKAGLLTQRRIEVLLQQTRSAEDGDALLYASWPHLYNAEWLERALRKAKAAEDDSAAVEIQERLSLFKGVQN